MAGSGRGQLLLKAMERTQAKAEEFSAATGPLGRGKIFAHFFEGAAANDRGDSSRAEAVKPIGRGDGIKPVQSSGHSDSSTETAQPIGRGSGAVPRPIGRGGMGRANLFKSFSSTPPVAAAESVISSSSSISDISSLEPIIKKGLLGKPICVHTNYVRLKATKDKYVYEYHVSFNPQVDSKKLRMRFMYEIEDIIGPGRDFDGAKLYLPIRLGPLTLIEKNHPYSNTPQQIIIKYVTKHRLENCIHLFNVLFKRIMRVLKLKIVSRKYFNPEEARFIPQYKLQIWPGYVTSVMQYEGGLMLMCDASHKVIRECTAFEVMDDCRHKGGNWKAEAEKELIGKVIVTRYNNKTYRVDEILWDKNVKSDFPESTGNFISYVDYYKKQYNIDIKEPGQPLILYRQKPARGTTETRMICLVPELSYLTGVSDKMKNDFKVMKSVAEYTRLTPNQRTFAFKRFLDNINKCEEAAKVLSDWGLELEQDLLKLDARTIAPTRLLFGSGQTGIVSERAEWNNLLSNQKVFSAVSFKHWAIIFCGRDGMRASCFEQRSIRVGPNMGIEINKSQMIQLNDDRIDTYITAIDRLCRTQPGIQIIVCICPTSRDDRYAAIKKKCYIDLGVPNQVINVRTISKDQTLNSVTQKIVLQMNCKLGGELWGVHVPIPNLMVVGIDVYHDTAQRNKSVVGFVCSMNKSFTKWYSKTCFQSTHQELGDGLNSCMMAALKKYYEFNHILPESICVYRDGVSDGQFKFVEEYEVAQMVKGFNCSENYHPKLSVIIVQKRINTRIFAVTGRGGGSDVMNPLPGTVLDHTVTRFNQYDFFLVSQYVTQGTVTPTHYTVLRDDNNFSPDNMQKLSYVLTHMYFNWPGTVRVPAPCQYAHRLAQLTGQHLHNEADSNLCDKLFFL